MSKVTSTWHKTLKLTLKKDADSWEGLLRLDKKGLNTPNKQQCQVHSCTIALAKPSIAFPRWRHRSLKRGDSSKKLRSIEKNLLISING